MSEQTSSTSQLPSNYKDPLPPGAYLGVVKNNVDSARSGRLQVYVQHRGAADPNNPANWQTVVYCPPFYGTTPTGAQAGTGAYLQGNPQSYGMWFTPPDLGTQVLILQVSGEAMAYYVGCVPSLYATHMVPAIGSVPKSQAQTQNSAQASYFAGSAFAGYVRCCLLTFISWVVTIDRWQGSFVTSLGAGGVKPSRGSSWFVERIRCVCGGGSSCVSTPRFFGALANNCFWGSLVNGFGALPSHPIAGLRSGLFPIRLHPQQRFTFKFRKSSVQWGL